MMYSELIVRKQFPEYGVLTHTQPLDSGEGCDHVN